MACCVITSSFVRVSKSFLFFLLLSFLPSPPLPPSPPPSISPHCAVYSQLQQELNYRYLQDQSGAGPGSIRSGNRGTAAFSAPHSQPNNPHQQVSVKSKGQILIGCKYGFRFNVLFRILQGLVGVASSAMDQSESGRPHRIRWCSAHVTIAKQILAHQQQSKVPRPLLHLHHHSLAGPYRTSKTINFIGVHVAPYASYTKNVHTYIVWCMCFYMT